MKKKIIPVFTPSSYKNNYFNHSHTHVSIEAMQASVAHFEIHRRDDFRFKCRETIASNRLDFYLVFIVTGGEGIHTFGDKEYYLKPGMLCFVSPGLITSWQTTVDDHAGYFCAFTPDFFQKGLSDQEALSKLPFFQMEQSAVLKVNQEQTSYFNGLFSEIEDEYHSDNVFKADMIRALLNLLFQRGIKLMEKDHGYYIVDAGNAAQRITNEFIKIVQKDFQPILNQETVVMKKLSDYAKELFVTQNHLNDTVKSIIGKTPGVFIREKIVKEATQLLVHTTLGISEIAYLFGFEDPSYFARFYKKYTGISPKKRRQQKNSE